MDAARVLADGWYVRSDLIAKDLCLNPGQSKNAVRWPRAVTR
jgi:hypothetical protein